MKYVKITEKDIKINLKFCQITLRMLKTIQIQTYSYRLLKIIGKSCLIFIA